jgi:CRP/FNR family transcriptional regulator, anaerobic regulatory protein
MQDPHTIDRWLEAFPRLKALALPELDLVRSSVHFPVLEPGAVAYRQDAECPNFVMCVDGLTRVFKLSDSGRELLIYKVGSGSTCLLTTQCLLSGTRFPAESVAEARTTLAVLPAGIFHSLMRQSAPFRDGVLDDYARLLGSMFALVDDLAFATLEQRLARRLLADADARGIVAKTHQQLASDVGSVREVVSRLLGEWERAGLIGLQRGHVAILDRAALAGT